ncbi:MAG: nicotinate-nucleotide adenylyltransferase [Candidatus Promineifilaceae bacterium]
MIAAAEPKRRIGLLGGTFDPPHHGHLLLAQLALEQLHLDVVYFLPVGDPTHKNRPDLSNVSQRVSMTVLAIADVPRFSLSLSDCLRPEPHYTSTLLPLIHDENPDADLWYVIGGDSLRDFYKWNEPASIIAQCRLAVLPRPGADVDWDKLAGIVGLQERVDLLAGELADISSTMLRRMENSAERHHYLPAAVLDFIERHDLYRDVR